jgi:hypothetical protein
MTEWVGLILDIVMIACVGVGVVQATRLIGQLRDLRASRAEMEKFVREFNSAVIRAEAGIKSLRATARESGDDLEKLVGKGIMIRDELNFIVESADGVAERLSTAASSVMHTSAPQSKAPEPARQSAPTQPVATAPAAPPPKAEVQPPSRAEQELLQALKKMS